MEPLELIITAAVLILAVGLGGMSAKWLRKAIRKDAEKGSKKRRAG
jgi:hypothetical protein